MSARMKEAIRVAILLTLAGCAGWERGCSAGCNSSFGADWVVVQYRQDGSAFNCWQLRGASMDNEAHSDGLYWQDPVGRELVHISGWYNRVQVEGGNFDKAARLIGVDLGKCGSGAYPSMATAAKADSEADRWGIKPKGGR